MNRTDFTSRRLTPLLLALGLSACQSSLSPDPEPVPPQLAQLNAEQRAFVSSPDNLSRFNLTEEKLLQRLERLGPERGRVLVDDLMATSAAAAYQPDQDGQSPIAGDGIAEPLNVLSGAAEIPLNTEAGDFNKSTVLRPPLFDPIQREPGPFSLKRYIDERGGIPTFANAPVAIRQADLIAGQVEVAFLGLPQGLGSGWRDSHHAPTVLRGMYDLAGYDTHSGLDPTLLLNIADYGNLSIDNLSAERNVSHIREMLGGMLEAGVIPFIVGGDHSLMFSSVAAMSDHYGPEALGVVHLDAHYRGVRGLPHTISDQQPVSRLIEEGLLPGANLVQLGLRGGQTDADAYAWLREQGVRYHSMAEVDADGWTTVLERVLNEARGMSRVFISFDMSVLDPAFARGAGRPVPGGLTIREALTSVRRLCTETEVVGFEMLDVAPYLDVSYQTGLNANAIMHACLNGIALRKTGIDSRDHLSPMAVRHDP